MLALALLGRLAKVRLGKKGGERGDSGLVALAWPQGVQHETRTMQGANHDSGHCLKEDREHYDCRHCLKEDRECSVSRCKTKLSRSCGAPSPNLAKHES